MRHRRRVVFPNRDGVLLVSEVRNRKSFAARRASDLLIYPGVATALVRLKEAGHGLVFATNQPDVAVGHAAGVAQSSWTGAGETILDWEPIS